MAWLRKFRERQQERWDAENGILHPHPERVPEHPPDIPVQLAAQPLSASVIFEAWHGRRVLVTVQEDAGDGALRARASWLSVFDSEGH